MEKSKSKTEIIGAILCVLYYYVSSRTAQSFMIDTKDPYIYYAHNDGYYFGYSLAIHKTNGDGKHWLIVGAPRGNETSRGNNPRHGAIYKCDLALNNDKCSVISQFDRKDVRKEKKDGVEYDREIRHDQWLGATVQSVKNYVMGCAPRFAYTGYKREVKWLALLGKCQMRDLENDANRETWQPCLRNLWRGRDFQYCQIGLGASMTPDAQSIVSGAIGILNHEGRIFYTGTFEEAALMTGGQNLGDSDYMGYTVAVGKFTSDKTLAIAGGAPRGNKLQGMVMLYKLASGFPFLTVLSNPSKQIGSYFGSVLAAIDVNGDGFSDLLVGAPFFSKIQDEGAVYVFLNNKKNSLDDSSVILDGDNTPAAKFGWSIASVGDLNLDKYEDVAVGAPYGGPDGKGAVYIYQGSRQGIENKYIQKILPSSIVSAASKLSTFGNSITGGIDVDGNGYPDLAVGSFMSDRAVFLRSRPIVSIIGSIKLNLTKISINFICEAHDKKIYKCANVPVNVHICFETSGKGLPNRTEIRYTLEVDKHKVADKRVFLFDKGIKSYKINSNISSYVDVCIDHVAYIRTDIRDIFKPLLFDVSYDYIPPKSCQLCPVMNGLLPKSRQITATYVIACGNNNICEADLVVNAKPVIPGDRSNIILGVISKFSLDINVTNKGEKAYLPVLSVIHSNDVSVVGVYPTSAVLDWDVEKVNRTHNKLVVNIENPMKGNVTRRYEAKFDMATAQPSSEIPFQIDVTTASNDTNPLSNTVRLAISVVIIADLTISGVALPDHLTYRNNVTLLKTAGPFVYYTLFVQNRGPSPAESSIVAIKIPIKLKDNFLLNLLGVSVEGSGSCDIDKSKLNPLNLTNIDPENKNSKKKRKKRDINEILDCTKTTCMDFLCNIGRLGRGDNVIIKLKSTIVEKTFHENVRKSSKLVLLATVSPSKNIQQPPNHLTDHIEVEVTINEPPRIQEGKQKEIPWWIILVSVLAGLILIAGVAFLCYKKGFFNRKKHDKIAAEEPLNEDY